ncbi:MAG TPA: hypothetical protein VNU68_28235 [Verrucomicrobiae bacterium]|nr:hypothetical protein [Verrucomicrobiae bacterium]
MSFGPPLVLGPRLDSVRSGWNLVFFWPVSSTNFDLEMSSQLSAPNWTKVGITPVDVGGRNMVSLGMTNVQQYFRLRHP